MPVSKIYFQAELQIARTSRSSSIRVVGRGNHAIVIWVRDRSSRGPVSCGFTVLSVVKDVERLNAEGSSDSFRDSKALAEGGIDLPMSRCAHRVST